MHRDVRCRWRSVRAVYLGWRAWYWHVCQRCFLDGQAGSRCERIKAETEGSTRVGDHHVKSRRLTSMHCLCHRRRGQRRTFTMLALVSGAAAVGSPLVSQERNVNSHAMPLSLPTSGQLMPLPRHTVADLTPGTTSSRHAATTQPHKIAPRTPLARSSLGTALNH
jgi:hypothetical protein